VKLVNINDKTKIFKAAKNLKAHNEDLKKHRPNHPYVYVSEHLPAIFQEQKKSLWELFKAARRDKLNTMWKVVDGKYCLFINGVKTEPTM